MEIADWKKLFAPHILSRGEEYYESELVEIEAMDEQSIEATVEGTDTYSVEIVLKNNRVAQMDCDCPYAAETEPLEPYQESLVADDPGNPISDYFSELREKDQLLLILKYQENLREAEIASVLHVPRGTVSSRLSRLLDRLREELKKEESGNA